ncbi:hypothetical protein WI76_07035 [Burkholderia ubonensis]|nr:hypothetical protein WI76_07035 [Burkholderia ubonensis]
MAPKRTKSSLSVVRWARIGLTILLTPTESGAHGVPAWCRYRTMRRLPTTMTRAALMFECS